MSHKKKIAVVLAGCGVYDGAEIHEATLTLYHAQLLGAEYQCFAPDVEQHHVVNHLDGSEMPEKRNVLVEAARIARGKILELGQYRAADYDALVFPGGFGVAKNLSSVAFDGAQATVLPAVERAIRETVEAGKPIGALCISPAIMAKVLPGARLTIGDDASTIEAVTAMGAEHVRTTHGEIVIDPRLKLVTTPCYMLEADIAQIGLGAQNLLRAVLEMA